MKKLVSLLVGGVLLVGAAALGAPTANARERQDRNNVQNNRQENNRRHRRHHRRHRRHRRQHHDKLSY